MASLTSGTPRTDTTSAGSAVDSTDPKDRDVAPVAVIIPLHDDSAPLATLLDRIATWSQRPDEIIVVTPDPGAGDALQTLAVRHGITLMVRDGTRGARLAAGARTASAPVLWFVHADADPDPRSLEHITAAIAAGAEAGCFRFRFQGPRTWIRWLLETLIALRIRCGGVAYGDQGLFVKRDVYEACGGHADQPLFEEVRWVRAVKARGGFRVLAPAIGVSARRWERDGWLARTLHNRWLAIRYMLGTPADRLAQAYRRPLRDNREAPR
jgi:rSAM/selenodomain-associated transferase 2